MKKIYLITVIMAFQTLLLGSQFSTRSEVQTSLNNIKYDEDVNAIINDYKMELQVHNVERLTIKVHRVVTLLNDKTSYDDIVIHYDRFNKVKNISVEILDANGARIKKFKKKDISDRGTLDGVSLHSDSRYKYIDASYGAYPYTIDLSYELESEDTRWYPNWNIIPTFDTYIAKSTYQLTIPKDFKIRYKAYNTDIEPTITSSNNKAIYTWKAKDIASLSRTSYLPQYEKILPSVKIKPTKFSLAGREGDMSTWESLGKFYYKLNKGRDRLSPEMIKKVKSLTKNATSDIEKVQILYDYLQANTRYVSIQLGVGGWQTFDAAYVTENKYGDCKALSNYMKAMLKAVGVTAHTALIYAGNRIPSVDTEFPTDAFNHAILNVPQEGEDIWLECTDSYKPANYLSSFTENRYALVVTPEGGKLLKTPHKSHQSHIEKYKITVDVNEKGSAKAKVLNQKFENRHDSWRRYSHSMTEKEQREKLEKVIDLPSFQVENLVLNIFEDRPQADLTYDLAITRLAKTSGKRIFMSPNLMNKWTYIPKEVEREYPIERIKGYAEFDTVQYNLPFGYEVENLPHQDYLIETEFGKYEISIEVEDGKLIYIRHLEMYSFNLPKEKYAELRDFYTQITKIDKMKVVLVNKRA